MKSEPESNILPQIISADANGFITAWSPRAESIVGYSTEEILGKHFSIFCSTDSLRKGAPAELLKLARTTGEANCTDWLVHKNSSHFWAFLQLRVYPDGNDSRMFFIEITAMPPANRVAESLRVRNAELELELGLRTDELGSQTSRLGERTSELSAKTKQFNTAEALNVSLEGQLDERTAELGSQTSQLGERTIQLSAKTAEFNTVEALNKELEAFTYAASHDLRAPLRSIDGFSLVLLEDYGSLLDAKAQDYLNRIRACAQRMGQLIDDLIGLSSLTKGDLKRESCDISLECRKIAAELQRVKPEREVIFKIEHRLNVQGDLRLIRIVLENLLGNAFKYTSKIPEAVIEVGCNVIDSENIFFIRDNGAGFDMKYAHKLFAPFQRLHGISEFEGNGIGLATVQRIVNRHGGLVWIESEVGKGTIVFFTI